MIGLTTFSCGRLSSGGSEVDLVIFCLEEEMHKPERGKWEYAGGWSDVCVGRKGQEHGGWGGEMRQPEKRRGQEEKKGQEKKKKGQEEKEGQEEKQGQEKKRV